MYRTCSAAFVDRKLFYVDGEVFSNDEGIILIAIEKTPAKAFMVFGNHFDFNEILVAKEILKSKRIGSISIVNAAEETIETLCSTLKDSFFPYVSAINFDNIFMTPQNPSIETIKLTEFDVTPEAFRPILTNIFNVTMIDPYLDCCGFENREVIKKIHDQATATILKQPCVLYFKGAAIVGFLSWKTDFSWREPTIVSTHYVDTNLSSAERAFIHGQAFEKLKSFPETKCARIHAHNSRSRNLFKKNNFIENEFLFIGIG